MFSISLESIIQTTELFHVAVRYFRCDRTFGGCDFLFCVSTVSKVHTWAYKRYATTKSAVYRMVSFSAVTQQYTVSVFAEVSVFLFVISKSVTFKPSLSKDSTLERTSSFMSFSDLVLLWQPTKQRSNDKVNKKAKIFFGDPFCV